MSDLISRKVLLAKVMEANPMGGMIGGKFIEDLIKNEECAYDVDKVVEILNKDAQMLYSMGNFSPVKAWENKYLIPVIKAGGSKTWMDILKEGAVKDEQ
jgi:hypothetical protein